MQSMEEYFDKFEMLSQGPPNRDGGDSTQRMGLYHFALWVRSKLNIPNTNWYNSNKQDYLNMIYEGMMDLRGYLRRHPDHTKWYSDWDRASRDQSIPFVITCGVYRYYFPLKIFFNNHLKKRFLLFTSNTIPNWVYSPIDNRRPKSDRYYELKNIFEKIKFYIGWRPRDEKGNKLYVYSKKLPDFTGIGFMALYIRSFRLYFLYPFLFISDFSLLVSAIHRRYSNDADVLNHVMIAVNAKFNYPTPISYLSNKINNWDNLYSKFQTYFNSQEGSIKDMVKLWKPIFVYMKTHS